MFVLRFFGCWERASVKCSEIDTPYRSFMTILENTFAFHRIQFCETLFLRLSKFLVIRNLNLILGKIPAQPSATSKTLRCQGTIPTRTTVRCIAIADTKRNAWVGRAMSVRVDYVECKENTCFAQTRGPAD